jgi:DNA-binding LacI/PurR family transcriptional regulator
LRNPPIGVSFLAQPTSESQLPTPPARRRESQRKSRVTPHQVALLFNAKKAYDREIISGIGAYLRSTRAEWDLFIEDDFGARLTSLAQWHGDGIIADYDAPAVSEALAGTKLPVVAVGGSYEDHANYPKGVPYVATDNFKLVKLAHDHRVEAGLHGFLPRDSSALLRRNGPGAAPTPSCQRVPAVPRGGQASPIRAAHDGRQQSEPSCKVT